MALDPKDLQWLKDLHAKSWESKSDRNGRYSMDLPIHEADRRSLKEVLEKNRNEFVFEPGSGVFGFGVSLNVYLPPTYPGTPATHIITVTTKQMYPDHDKRGEMYTFVESFTHTPRNREAREVCGFREKLHSMSYYDY